MKAITVHPDVDAEVTEAARYYETRSPGLAELSEELQCLVLEILLHPPVSNILLLSAYSPSPLETIPITSLQLASSAG